MALRREESDLAVSLHVRYSIFTSPMNSPKNIPSPLAARVTAPLFLTATLLLALAPVSSATANDHTAPQPTAEKAAKPPLESSFSKEKTGETAGLHVLTLKNISQQPVKISGVVALSVVVHNRDKTRTVPSQVLEAGKTARVEGLASHDKVTITAEGFAPLELTVP